MSEVTIHPFDVEKLSKGDWITPDQCEEVLGIRRDDRRYSLRLLAIRDELERNWLEQREEVITIVSERDGLLVCTDDKAVEVNRERRLGHVRGLERAQRRQMGIAIENLSTPELRARHERECVVGAAFLVGGKKEQRIALKEHKRLVPKMLK